MAGFAPFGQCLAPFRFKLPPVPRLARVICGGENPLSTARNAGWGGKRGVPRHYSHSVLDEDAAGCLRCLADPEASDARPLPRLTGDRVEALFLAAQAHGVLPAVFRAVKSRLKAVGGRPGGRATDFGPYAGAIQAAEERLHIVVGQSLRLYGYAEKAMAALTAAGLDAATVKGPVFASLLYPRRSDRSYTDIDILVDRSAVKATGAVMRELGFEPLRIEGRDSDVYGEHKWVLPADSSIMIELHEGLVHSPTMRRSLSLDLAQCRMAGGGDAADAAALLLVAGVHAAAGDHFDRLQPLVDVMQAARGRAGPVDEARLLQVGAQSGCLRAVAVALRVAGRVFSEVRCMELAERLMPRANRLETLLVAPSVVLAAQSAAGRRVSWRRKIVRQLIRRPVRRPARAEG